MASQADIGKAKDWPLYADPEGRYSLRYPVGWTATRATGDRAVIAATGSGAEFVIEYSARDCAEAESELRQRRLNYYLVREFTRTVGSHEVRVFELRDTISNLREFRTFVTVEGACCEVRWARPAGSESPNFESAQEAMLSTLDFTSSRSRA